MFWQARVGFITGRGAIDAVGLVAPVNTVLPVISGTTTVGQTLSTTTGTWTGSPTGYTYQWKRGGANISGATASTYLLVTADLAATITVTVTATNTAGNANATSTGVGPVAMSYATWDTATASNVTFSGGNLIATSTGGTTDHGCHVVGSCGKVAGKYYFEITLTTYGGGGDTCWGIGTPASTYAGMGFSNGTTGVTQAVSGNIYSNGSFVLGTTFSGTIVCIAVDLDNGKIWFRPGAAGIWNGNSGYNPATNTGGVAVPPEMMVPFAVFSASGNVWTANFGASAFVGAVPSGFTSGWPVTTTKFIDGSAGGQFSSGTTGTVTLSTTTANDLIVLMYFHEQTSARTIATVTSPHLTWTKRSNYAVTLNGFPSDLEIWWAPSSAVLTSEVVTITTTGTIDDAAYHVFGVNGCANIASPWDTNGSLATARANANPATSATVSGVSTNSTVPMILGCTGAPINSTIIKPVGTTQVRAPQNNPGGSKYAYFTSFYQNYSSAVASASYTTTDGNTNWAMVIDALA